jgi:hypothetical protein
MRTIVNTLNSLYSVDIIQAINKALPRRRLYLKGEKQSLMRENTAEEKLMHATTEAQEDLLTATAVFPLNLFPDTISLDREKLTIVHRSFFSTSDTISMQVGDILSVKGNVGPFFGNLVLSTRYFDNSTQTIKFLRRQDALKLQTLIQGCIIAHHRQIDCTDIERDQLVTLLSDLGQATKS